MYTAPERLTYYCLTYFHADYGLCYRKRIPYTCHFYCRILLKNLIITRHLLSIYKQLLLQNTVDFFLSLYSINVFFCGQIPRSFSFRLLHNTTLNLKKIWILFYLLCSLNFTRVISSPHFVQLRFCSTQGFLGSHFTHRFCIWCRWNAYRVWNLLLHLLHCKYFLVCWKNDVKQTYFRVTTLSIGHIQVQKSKSDRLGT